RPWGRGSDSFACNPPHTQPPARIHGLRPALSGRPTLCRGRRRATGFVSSLTGQDTRRGDGPGRVGAPPVVWARRPRGGPSSSASSGGPVARAHLGGAVGGVVVGRVLLGRGPSLAAWPRRGGVFLYLFPRPK